MSILIPIRSMLRSSSWSNWHSSAPRWPSPSLQLGEVLDSFATDNRIPVGNKEKPLRRQKSVQPLLNPFSSLNPLQDILISTNLFPYVLPLLDFNSVISVNSTIRSFFQLSREIIYRIRWSYILCVAVKREMYAAKRARVAFTRKKVCTAWKEIRTEYRSYFKEKNCVLSWLMRKAPLLSCGSMSARLSSLVTTTPTAPKPQGAEEFSCSLALLCKPYILTYMKDARIQEGYRRTITSHRRCARAFVRVRVKPRPNGDDSRW